MEIIIEKKINPGRIAFNPFIASNRSYVVFPLRDTFTIEKIRQLLEKSSKYIEDKCSH